MTHNCRAIGCKHQVTEGKLMCLRHWRMVPKLLQDEIVSSFRAWGKALRAKDFTLAMQKGRAHSMLVEQARTAGTGAEAIQSAGTGTGPGWPCRHAHQAQR